MNNSFDNSHFKIMDRNVKCAGTAVLVIGLISSLVSIGGIVFLGWVVVKILQHFGIL